MKFDYHDWILECDVEATRDAYAHIEKSGTDQCTCSYCRNYCTARAFAFPETVRHYLAQLGVDWHREAECYHLKREDSGLHSYGGWLHFIGNIEQHGVPVQVTEHFLINFSNDYAPMFSPFKNRSVVQIQFTACLPWLLKNEPEPM